ncbi:hypothetical protein DMN91_008764 [Ooceraea biroi]|uniref:Protein D7 n=1 Tax=Ooceraea biroi TaxID=2015173 RepID=A0A026WRL4_OOCBI|nr:protein D7 [Ooceraea biroi]EZA58680.1 Protein D7 [Ooceraea biroi]RLU18407.1 hypothetical protein DMN91_008764 [Ooceraea biroi]
MSHENNDVLRCPFNNGHAISRTRFQRHLVKCEKNYPPDYKVICPYDATHRIGKDKIVEHINTCPVRKVLEGSYLRCTESSSADAVTSVESDSVSEIDRKDHWYSDVEDVVAKSLRNSFRHSEPVNQINGSDTDDLESQVSAMGGIGRGTIRSNYNQYFDTESDAEPMVNSMAVGRGRVIANTIKYHNRVGLRGRKI